MSHSPARPARQVRNYYRTPWQIAWDCLVEARDDLDQAMALAGKRARGAKLRMVIRTISDPHWRANRE
jgi:hypothetical protein